jgi:maleate cis-trans isomerase
MMHGAATSFQTQARELALPSARVGLIIPSVNTLSEPQFNHYGPAGLAMHVARARVAGEWRRPFAELKSEIAAAAERLADCKPDLIVFHCTDTSMAEGPQGEGRILDLIRSGTGVDALSTSALVLEALQALGLKKLVVLSPYRSNASIIGYLQAVGIEVVHDVALGLSGLEFPNVTPQDWLALARKHDRPAADGIFLSCTNTRQIEAIADIEQALGKPVVNSNQAVLWGCVKRLRQRLGDSEADPALGRLMQVGAE